MRPPEDAAFCLRNGHNHIKQGQETNQIWTQEAGTHDTQDKRTDNIIMKILSIITPIITLIFSNLGSLEIRASTYISAKLKKLTYIYDSLQFPVEMNTRGSKTLFLFTRSVTYRNSFDYFLTVTCRMVCYDFKTILTSWTIWKLILLNVVVTYTASYVWVY